MTLEELADLIRANSANTNRRISETRNETYGQLLTIQSDLTDIRGDVKSLQGDMAEVRADTTALRGGMAEIKADVGEVRRSLDLAESVAAMKRQIEALEPRSPP